MKNFFKSKLNIVIVSFVALALIFMVLSLVIPILVTGCLLSIAIVCFLFAAKFIARYRRIKELKKDTLSLEGEVLDGSEYGYDQDIYVVPDDNKKVMKRKLSLSFDSLAPAILFIVIGAILVGMTIRLFFM